MSRYTPAETLILSMSRFSRELSGFISKVQNLTKAVKSTISTYICFVVKQSSPHVSNG